MTKITFIEIITMYYTLPSKKKAKEKERTLRPTELHFCL